MTGFNDYRKLFLDYCGAKNLSRDTIDWYKYRLLELEKFMAREGIEFADITINDLRRMISQMIHTNKGTTVNHTITAIKRFFSWLFDEEFIKTNPAVKLEKIRTPKILIEPLSEDDINRLLGVLDTSKYVGLRDYTMIVMSIDTGVRLNEILNMKLSDLSLQYSQIRVMGKGSKERIVPFGKTVARILRHQYLPRRADIESPYLFVSEYGEKLSKKGYQDNIKRYARLAGIGDKRVSPHTFRHTFAVNWIRNNGDVFSLQKIGGWSSLEIARRYVNLGTDDIHTAMNIHSPADRMIGDGIGTARHRGKRKIR